MAELNFGLLTPPGSQSIGNAFVTGMDQGQEARARDLQMQQSMRQGQMAELQYKKAQDAEAKLNQFYAHVADNGGPQDPIAIEDQMIRSGIPQVANTGLSARMTRLKVERDRMLYAAANAPAASVPTGGTANMLPGVVQTAPAEGTANMLPGAVQGAPVVPPRVRSQMDELNARIDANLALGTDQGNKTADLLQKQADNLSRRYTVGNTLMSGAGGVVATAPAAVPPPRQPNLAADLLIPGPNGTMVPNTALIGIQTGLRQAGRPQGATVVMPPLEKTEQQEKGKLNVKAYGDIAATADRARKILPALETSEAILNGGFKTGFGAEVQTQAARVLSVLGVPEADKYATDSQLFLAQGRQALLQRQLEQKGAQSEGDAQRINQTFIQLGNTPEANKFLVATAKAQSKQDIARQKFYSDFWAKSKTYEGAEESWLAGAGGKSLFDSPEMKSFAPQKPPSDISSAAAAELARRKQKSR